MTKPAVHATHVSKSFGQRCVLRDVDFHIDAGEVVSLIGPSGAGKSTMLRCLTLLDRFSAGEFGYGDLTVCSDQVGFASYGKDTVAKARMHCGIVFQNYNLFPHMTVLRNVYDAAVRVQRRDKAEAMQAARELLDKLGLSEHVDKVPCDLSGGQQQRVAIARALCLKPEVLFFDEATSALDPKLTAEMRDLIRSLAADGMAVGIVTHEMGFAREVSDRVAFLFDGAIAEQGSPAQVIDNPQTEVVRNFLSCAAD
jgi:polar amino acid transport system ATP-binding protein